MGAERCRIGHEFDPGRRRSGAHRFFAAARGRTRGFRHPGTGPRRDVVGHFFERLGKGGESVGLPTRLLDVVKVSGPAEAAISQLLADAWIADSFDAALATARELSGPVTTLTGEIFRGEVPPYAVVVPGSTGGGEGKPALYCAVIVKRVDAQTRSKTSINELLRE